MVRCCTRSRLEELGAAGRLIKEVAKGNDKLQAKVVAIGGAAVSRRATSTSWHRCRPATSALANAGPRPDRAGHDVCPRRSRPLADKQGGGDVAAEAAAEPAAETA
ncbi:hypothetical protein ACE0DR_25615 [Azotobacter sp. CWF10]